MGRLIKINGVVIPTPSEFTVGHQDLVKAERNARGNMVMDFIARKVKLEFVWSHLTQQAAKTIFDAIDPPFFTVEYPDPQKGIRTLTFYKGDRKVPMLIYRNGVPFWQDVGFNVIER